MEYYVLWIIVILLFIFIIMSTFYTEYVRRERIEMQKEAVVGDMKYSARTADFSHWLICNGRSLNRVDYKHLFDVIGTSYGSASATTFNLPDFRGRVLGAIGNGVSLTNRPIGTAVGEEKHTMILSELVTHAHEGTTNAAGSHTHTGTTENGGVHTHTGTTNTTGDHTHTGTTDISGNHTHTHNAPGGQNNLGLAVADGSNTVVDTDGSGGELNVWTVPRGLNLANNGSHSHTVSNTTNGSHSHTVETVASDPHTHTFTSSSNGQHTHTFTSNTTGNSLPFNVMQPTLFAGNVFIYYGCH
jgi:microcystin-dependent protein